MIGLPILQRTKKDDRTALGGHSGSLFLCECVKIQAGQMDRTETSVCLPVKIVRAFGTAVKSPLRGFVFNSVSCGIQYSTLRYIWSIKMDVFQKMSQYCLGDVQRHACIKPHISIPSSEPSAHMGHTPVSESLYISFRGVWQSRDSRISRQQHRNRAFSVASLRTARRMGSADDHRGSILFVVGSI